MYLRNQDLTQTLDLLQGVLFTGGDQIMFNEDGSLSSYLETVRLIVDYAKQQFELKRKFVLMGTCLGFESMTLVLSNYELVLKDVYNLNKSIDLRLRPEFFRSRLL